MTAMTPAQRPPERLDAPPDRLVRHVFWKYPILSVVLLVLVAILAALVGSPNYPRDTIAGVTKLNPGGAILAFTQELDGTASSSTNAQEFGMGDPGEVFVLAPLRAAAPLLGEVSVQGLPSLQNADVRQAIATYDSANADQHAKWAAEYDKALGTIMPTGDAAMGVASPDAAKVGSLSGDFGPVPMLVEADTYLAQTGYLEANLQSVEPGHSFHLTNIWLYDHPNMLNTAVDEGLTDDQWGMVKERGFSVGPWYLSVPSVFHVYFPQGATGQAFVLYNLAFAAILLFVIPLVPGVRSVPLYLKLYRFIYRYPRPNEMESVQLRERHDPTHGGS
jgi:hypothetical protein